VKRVGLGVLTKLARFTKEVVTLAQKAVVGNPRPALRRGLNGYADWVIVSIHGLKTYLDLPYRRLLDVLYEMPRIDRILGLEPSGLPDFTTRLFADAKVENADLAPAAAAIGGAARHRRDPSNRRNWL